MYYKEESQSPQKQLFALLNDHQKDVVAQHLWPLKGRAQELLCNALIEYMVHGVVMELNNVVIYLIFSLLTGYEMYEGYEAELSFLPNCEDPRKGIRPNEKFELVKS